ncbi:cyclic lactone autoinducer peptide [Anaeromicropila populeti]|uniref:Cyclic lactone autoinducer peptide n=1 Tax=Anaeromicropila populeti TaxID=37658 RepID=A0A1I6LH82_9FIRM|nr:cyclic lactone autoinducer peptide [Anaeromicropila populeti]SFS02658.1 cyclic lactone autoinducer peptide [Anaeromicropila populeti]
MGKKVQWSEKITAWTAEAMVKQTVSSACWFFLYQPKLPKGAERFKR